ncbi:RHS repeat domain-containing protein [Actinoallomurus sp. NBC_01490]|uniref:RHS repeat domain-containing protein n=1 Tax=Actinoallomurus sp. NBC_01490 TaxID=2903557 RepID=UPI002E33BC91|nr:RHS repeat-associated core domain-containing protein [Actinoallomurus sp. NBC_01490]
MPAVPGGASGSVTWECVPGDLRPLTQLERRGPWTGLHAVITDRTGAPAELVDPSGDIVWRSRATLWGVRWPGTADRVACPLGFPGQYHDAETGLAYNLRRYYDPATARYLSADPLGLVPVPGPPYGLRVRVPSGEIGVLDSAFVGDGPVDPADWPQVGSEITVVSGGRTSGGQLRLSTRPSHLAHARELARRHDT